MKLLKSIFAKLTAAIAEQRQDAEFSQHFTPQAQQTFVLAEEEAARLNHNFIGTEHVLLGLLKLNRGVAVNVLKRQGVDLAKLRNTIEEYVLPAPDPMKMQKPFPFTPRVKRVLVIAQKEARALHHIYVGTEHILLGLLGDGDGVAARVLQGLGLRTSQTRQEILKELDPNFDEGEQPPST